MKKNLYIDFAENYHMNFMPNPTQNKLWVLAVCMVLPAFLGWKIGMATMSTGAIISTAIVLIMGVLANRFGNIEVFNHIGLFFGLGINYSWALIQLAILYLGFSFYFNVAFVIALFVAFSVGILYTKRKVRRGISNKSKKKSNAVVGAIGAAVAFIATKIMGQFIDVNLLFLLFAVGGYILVFYGVPQLVLLSFQYYMLKKYHLLLK